ncbi:VOC family protein [Streptomyces sp. NP-1717]|uniref:VOC family protein n=1 Tax=unclassified Streptomyces TaxID=2593676 RepID=UPI001F5C1EAE|nr:VOC family protein [Streptomyces sp. NP-1717]MCI3223959.1 VOC family protein [Streptomyces sp. NP-1717]WTA77301.1 VOC family protein [Streptomyces sp. NBC_00838]
MTSVTFTLVALDCQNPAAVAEFYQGVLGGEISHDYEGWWVLRVPGGARIAFQRAPGHRAPEWPRADSNSQQAHLDFAVADMAAAQEKVLALGATALDLDDDGGKRGFRVFADPAGHPFCLCRAV